MHDGFASVVYHERAVQPREEQCKVPVLHLCSCLAAHPAIGPAATLQPLRLSLRLLQRRPLCLLLIQPLQLLLRLLHL